MDKLLKQLLAPVAVSGRETEAARVIEDLARPYGEVSRDALGNLVVHRPGSGKRIMLTAHMDTVGLIVTYLEKEGYARVGLIGGVPIPGVVGQRVRFQTGVIGVVCADRGVEPKDLTAGKLYVDTAGQPVRVGDVAVYEGEPAFSGSMVFAHGLDNRLGCAICLRTMELLKERETDNDIYWTFTVQEEVGCRGAAPAAFTISPDLAISVDIVTVADTPGEGRSTELKLSGGPVVKLMDARIISHPSVVALLEDAGATLGIPTQRSVKKHGGTDAGAVSGTRGGVPSAALSVPIRNTHYPNEIADLRVAEDCAKILAEALTR